MSSRYANLNFNPASRAAFTRGAEMIISKFGLRRDPKWWADNPDGSLAAVTWLELTWRRSNHLFGCAPSGGFMRYIDRWVEIEGVGVEGCHTTRFKDGSTLTECFRTQVDMSRFRADQRRLPPQVLSRADICAYICDAAGAIYTRGSDTIPSSLVRTLSPYLRGMTYEPLPPWASVALVTKFLHGCGVFGATQHLVTLERKIVGDDPTDAIATLRGLGHPADSRRLAAACYVAYDIYEFKDVAVGRLIYELD